MKCENILGTRWLWKFWPLLILAFSRNYGQLSVQNLWYSARIHMSAVSCHFFYNVKCLCSKWLHLRNKQIFKIFSESQRYQILFVKSVPKFLKKAHISPTNQKSHFWFPKTSCPIATPSTAILKQRQFFVKSFSVYDDKLIFP